jgi:hypothetical protein
MWYVITRRVVKQSTGSTARFAPRSNNMESWHYSGPFEQQRMAERAAVSAMATHTCLSAAVLSGEQIASMVKDRWGQPHEFLDLLMTILRRHAVGMAQ